MKKTYSAPVIRAHGAVESLTQGQRAGNALDASFPVNTPKPQLTFS